MVGIPEILLLLALLILPLGCCTNWLAAIKTRLAGKSIVNWTERDNVDWGLLDLGIIVILVGLLAGLGVASIASAAGIEAASDFESMTPDERAFAFLAFGTATLIATACCFTWLWLRYQRIDGFSFAHLGPDIELGLRWFMMLVVPVILLQLLLTQWFPTKHPLIEMLRQSKDLSFLPIAAFSAVLSAPIFEEAFFRLFVQGWLEKLQITMRRAKAGVATKADTDAVLWGGASSTSMQVTPSEPTGPERTTQVAPQNLVENENPEAVGRHHVEDDNADRPILWIPILVSSGLFSLAHLSHGPDWLPLFLLALGLGYLYQRTGRIQACIVVHMLVNALAIIQLWAAVRQS